jgi:putative transposase
VASFPRQVRPLYCGQHNRSHNGPGHRISILWRATKWRSVKYENIYLRAYETGTQLRRGLTEYFDFYDGRRIHEALGYATPDEAYFGELATVTPMAA